MTASQIDRQLTATVQRLRQIVSSRSDWRLIEEAPSATIPQPIWDRLTHSGELITRGDRRWFDPASDGASWQLPSSYVSFLKNVGGLTVLDAGAKKLFSLDPPLSVAYQTDDMLDALSDHRHGLWPFEAFSDYGLDRCLFFSSIDPWMTGWAFDTRVVDSNGEFAIRQIIDWSADEGAAMETMWPRTPTDGVTPFGSWLESQINDLASRPYTRAEPGPLSTADINPRGKRFFLAGTFTAFNPYDSKHMIADMGGTLGTSMSAGTHILVLGDDDEQGERRAAIHSLNAYRSQGSRIEVLNEAMFIRLHAKWK